MQNPKVIPTIPRVVTLFVAPKTRCVFNAYGLDNIRNQVYNKATGSKHQYKEPPLLEIATAHIHPKGNSFQMNTNIITQSTESSKTPGQLRTEAATWANICAADKRRMERRAKLEARHLATDPNWTPDQGYIWAA